MHTGDRLRILMVSDFFYPNFGGVENHIYQLSQCLISQGHKVVVLTHAYGNCGGVRYLTNGLKVYYIYRLPCYAQSTLPTFFGAQRLLRVLCLRERISLVHAHQAFSTLGCEAILHARTMGYKVVFTDHSLFGFADANSILMNKLLKATLADVSHAICVSHTSKENTVLRACLPPQRVSVIPNAVDASEFQPDPSLPRPRPGDPVTVVALSRLVYRKGVDILALVIPDICSRHPHVQFIIGGDGPKRSVLEAMIHEEGLQQRVKLVGAVPHERAREFLLQGQVFINASLTEAFCMAIVEAACVGLLVVSTRVGGVPEVLPGSMMLLAEPVPEDLVAALESALQRVQEVDPVQQHQQVCHMYSWNDVASRTLRVYSQVLRDPVDDSLLARLRRHQSSGLWAGPLFCIIVLLLYFVWRLAEWLQPAADIDIAPDWPSAEGLLGSTSQQQQQDHRQQQQQGQQLPAQPQSQQGARPHMLQRRKHVAAVQ